MKFFEIIMNSRNSTVGAHSFVPKKRAIFGSRFWGPPKQVELIPVSASISAMLQVNFLIYSIHTSQNTQGNAILS